MAWYVRLALAAAELAMGIVAIKESLQELYILFKGDEYYYDPGEVQFDEDIFGETSQWDVDVESEEV